MPSPRRARRVVQEPLDAIVVESEPVDERLGLGQAERDAAWVAGLRARRDGAAFDEAETERGETVDVRGILVEAGGKADPVGKLQSHCGDGRWQRTRNKRLHEPQPRRGVEARERHAVRGFGVEGEEQRAKERVDHFSTPLLRRDDTIRVLVEILLPCRSDSVSSQHSLAFSSASCRRRRVPPPIPKRPAMPRAKTCVHSSARWLGSTASTARRLPECSGRHAISAPSWPQWTARCWNLRNGMSMHDPS